MPAKITRLELVIIVAALAVLLFSNRPPQPGNAETLVDTGPTTESTSDAFPQVQPDASQSPTAPELESIRTASPDSQSLNTAASDNLTTVSIPQPKARQKRYVMIDARKCDSLKYPEIMYGEVTVNRVWNGTTFEWRTVCQVKEKDGTISIWNLDDRHEGVVISPVTELPPNAAP